MVPWCKMDFAYVPYGQNMVYMYFMVIQPIMIIFITDFSIPDEWIDEHPSFS